MHAWSRFHEVIRASSHSVVIVMEYCDDGDIAEKIARRKFAQHHFEEEQVPRVQYVGQINTIDR